MTAIRPAAVAGFFYPDDADRLRQEVRGYIGSVGNGDRTPKAIIAPHAGYVYSGSIAGSAYAPLAPWREVVTRVVLLGPAHRVYVSGVAASSAGAFNTPLGPIPVDVETMRRVVSRFDFVDFNDAAHKDEHSLEVHLPFLQTIFNHIEIIPFAVGDARYSEIEHLLDFVWGMEETLIVISSDLSHYLDYQTAKEMDQHTSCKIRSLDYAALNTENACGQVSIGGLLRCAARRGMHCEVADVRNSGDTAGSGDQVVGYGAYLFYQP